MEFLGFPGKKVTVLGLGISGYQSALFLQRRGFDVWVSEGGASESVRQRLEELKTAGIAGECGGHDFSRLLSSDWILISPGIAPAAPVYRKIHEAGIPILSEIETASRFCPARRVLAVTGTCGKTTVTTLLQSLLTQARLGGRVVACGNIGNPWIGEIERLSAEDTVILELSSFQLEHCERFRPFIGILLNISPNHEDWHENAQAYIRAKLRLFQSQTAEDYALMRKQDHDRLFPQSRFTAQTVYFGEKEEVNPNHEVLKAVASILKIETTAVKQALESFQGIEHRLEVFHTGNGVTYVNDSKSTTTASLAWALSKYSDSRVILIAGGHPKSADFDTLCPLIIKKVKGAVLIGEARELLRKAWQGSAPLQEAAAFDEAVRLAHAQAKPGDVVLLSPACASFDMFKNYEERGRLFKQLVLETAGAAAAGDSHVQSR